MNLPPDVIQLAQALVRIPSVNPMGRKMVGETYLEGRVTDFLENLFTTRGIPCQRHEVLPGRENIIAQVQRGGPGAGTIMLEAHQDTVPVDGMTIDPYSGEIRDGRLYGRGSCDIKGGMAAMLQTIVRLAGESSQTGANVVMACTVNEENGFDGARQLRSLWESGESGLLPAAPDVIVVAEPTALNVVTAHKGAVRWRCSTVGQATHSSTPDQGSNAIYQMGSVLNRLESYASSLAGGSQSHPLVGRPTLSVGIIEGGISVNTVPDRCAVAIDRRLLPNESAASARAAVVTYLQEQLPELTLEHDDPFLAAPGLSDGHNGALARALSKVIQQFAHAGDIIGVPYGTDASTLASPQVPAVVFGPGDIAQAHTADEWIDVDQLRAAADILYAFCHNAAPNTMRATLES